MAKAKSFDEINQKEFIRGDFMVPEKREPIHPGRVLKEYFLEPLDMTQTELAKKMDVYVNRVNEFIHGKRGATPETAAMLAKIFNTSERYWLNMQNAYDLYKLHQSDKWEKIKTIKQAI
jgi:addiction module HigA family antidote